MPEDFSTSSNTPSFNTYTGMLSTTGGALSPSVDAPVASKSGPTHVSISQASAYGNYIRASRDDNPTTTLPPQLTVSSNPFFDSSFGATLISLLAEVSL